MQPSLFATTLLLVAGLVACADAHSEAVAADGTLDYAPWGRVLAAHARDGGVDYAALQADRADLDRFLAALESATPTSWTAAEQLAFWSNAYNAVVVEFVLERYPEIESVKDVDGFFDQQRRLVAGEQLTLDEIETRGRDLGDPRIHFAVVCASTSCPDLPVEPFDPAGLEIQLQKLTERFLSDPAKGLRYDEASNTLWLSSIFKWYAGDFTGGSTVVAFFARGQVVDWLLPHLPEPLRDRLVERQPSVRYLDYDWSLNDR